MTMIRHNKALKKSTGKGVSREKQLVIKTVMLGDGGGGGGGGASNWVSSSPVIVISVQKNCKSYNNRARNMCMNVYVCM